MLPHSAELASLRSLAELVEVATDNNNVTSTAIATRGERLVLSRVRAAAFQTEVLNVIEIDAAERIGAGVGFDVDDIDAAFQELDARYLAGEAAAHSHTWSLAVDSIERLNRRELPLMTPDVMLL